MEYGPGFFLLLVCFSWPLMLMWAFLCWACCLACMHFLLWLSQFLPDGGGYFLSFTEFTYYHNFIIKQMSFTLYMDSNIYNFVGVSFL